MLRVVRRWALIFVFASATLGCELVVGSKEWTLRATPADGATLDGATDGGGALDDDGGRDGNAPAVSDVVVIASGQAGPRGVALNATDVFWTNFDGNTVGTTPKNGDGGVAPPYTGADHPGPLDIVTYAQSVAWINTKNGALVMKPLAATSGVTVYNCGTATRLAQDANNLYYTEVCSSGSNLWSLPKTGTKTLFSQAFTPDRYTTLASDGLSVFAARKADIAVITSGADAGVFEPTPSEILDLAVDGTKVFWLTAAGTVNAKDKTGAGATQTLASGQAGLARLALYQDWVFWTAGGATATDGFVAYAPKDGSAAPKIVAKGQSQPFGIAVDESGIYFANAGSGTIAKVTWVKP